MTRRRIQLQNPSNFRQKPFFFCRVEMSKGGGLPLCLSGVGIMNQVPHQKTTSSTTFTRHRSSSRGSSATVNFGVRATLNHNATETCSRICDSEVRREDSGAAPSGCNGSDSNFHRPRNSVALRMAELDRRRLSLEKQRLAQGLGPFLREQAFMLLRQSSRPQESTWSSLQELIFAEIDRKSVV